jgi:uncharacterized protein (TIGR00369 family)
MSDPAPPNPGFEEAIRASFARQGMMATLGASLAVIVPGRIVIAAPIRPETGQQHGYAHAGLGWTIGDSAAGYAALSLLPAGWEVLTVEMKVNLLAPASGRLLVAEGRVIRPGKRLMVVASDIHAETETSPRRHVATMLGTMIPLPPEAMRG